MRKLAGLLPALGVIALVTQLGGCGGDKYLGGDGPPSRDRDVSGIPDAVPKPEPRSRYGNPEYYDVLGKRYYVLRSAHGYVERGTASWYGEKFHGRLTSNREPYDMFGMTAAHKTLPLPTYVRVTNLDNGRSVVVRVNDRGPFYGGRIIDLSYAAAKKLGIAQRGTGRVEVRALDPSRPGASPVAEPQYAEPNHRTLARPEPATPAKAGELYLQVAAFSSQANAERLVGRLHEASFANAGVSLGKGGTGALYRVRIGPLASPKDAERLIVQLNALGLGKPHVVTD